MRLVNKALYFSNKACVLLNAAEATVDTLTSDYDKAYIQCYNAYDLAWESVDLSPSERDEKFKLVYNILASNIIGTILAYTLMSQEKIPKMDLDAIASLICKSDCFQSLRNFCDEVYFSEEYIRSSLNLPVRGTIRINECNHDWSVPLVDGKPFYAYISVQALKLGLLNEPLRLVLSTKYFKMIQGGF